jgi:hypothetical protein
MERPFYEDREIEAICTDALREVGLLPTQPQAVRIDRFIEKRFGVVPTYEDLPDGVLGLTRFGKNGVREVVVAKALDDDSSTVAERRIRTTLAHEGGHCLLHTHLFALATPTQKLFGDFSEPDKPKVLCRDEVLGNAQGAYAGNWWEFQANRAIGGLLMPSGLVTESLCEFMLKGPAGFPHFDHDRIEDAARALAEVFNVNPLVAKIRIKQLFGADTQQQWLL